MSIQARYIRPIISILAASLLLSACSSEEAVPPPAPTLTPAPATAEPTASAEPTATPIPAGFSGLTGLPVDTPELPRPLAVMINNAPAARPQSGVSQADVLYEVLAEGGITRLVAIFQSQSGTEKIGPIRSIRPYLIDIGESFGGVLVHAGGSPAAYAILQSGGKPDLDEIGRGGPYFFRDRARKAPHNLYSSEEQLREGAAKLRFDEIVPVPSFAFTDPEAAPPGGEDAAEFSVKFLLQTYTVGYKYNETTRQYARWVNGAPHLDLNDSAPVEAANVLVIGANQKVLDDVGRLEVNLELGGVAMLFQRGEVTKGRWSRMPGDMIRFSSGGKEVPMYPGVTHVLVTPGAEQTEEHVTIGEEA